MATNIQPIHISKSKQFTDLLYDAGLGIEFIKTNLPKFFAGRSRNTLIEIAAEMKNVAELNVVFEVLLNLYSAYPLGTQKKERLFLMPGQSIGKFSYEQYNNSNTFDYALVTRGVANILNFFSEIECPNQFELTAGFAVAVGRNCLLSRSHREGNCIELAFLSQEEAMDTIKWMKSLSKRPSDPYFRKVPMLWRPDLNLLRIAGQEALFRPSHAIRRYSGFKTLAQQRGLRFLEWKDSQFI